MASANSRPGELISGINVTPMVDVVLVLLIVLMVTASYTVSKAISVELPRAATGTSSGATPLAISITESGALFLSGEPMSKDQLARRVRAHATRPEASALISADGGTNHRSVVGVIDLLRREGIRKFAINVSPEEGEP